LKEGITGQVQIGYVGTVMHSLLPGILKVMKKKYPDINTVFQELTNIKQVTALRSGDIDIGFIRTPLSARDITVKPVYTETFSLILSLSHPLSKLNEISMKELEGEPFISFSRECAPGMVDNIIGMCNKEGFSPHIVHESSQINSVVRLVESNLGYSIVPTSVKAGYNLKVKFYELSDFPERAEMSLAYNPRNLTPATEKVIDLILGSFKYQS